MESFKQRLLDAVADLTQQREGLLQQAAKLESQITKLSLLADGADDPDLETLIVHVASPVEIAPPEPIPEPAPPPPPSPPPIRRIRVTCDEIYAITQTFDRLFTTNDVVDLLADNESVTDPDEKTRVRSAVATMMRKLVENGRLVQTEKGAGKKPGWFRKVVTSDFRRLPAFKDGVPDDIEVETTTV